MPKISVITISMNRGHELEKTIRSVAEQGFKDFEYIVIDGNSTDETPEILVRFKNIIKKLIVEPDNGIYDAMNKGIKIATGDYIVFLNAGDNFTSTQSMNAINKWTSEKKAEVYYGKIVWVDTQKSDIVTSEHSHIQFRSQLYYENFPHPATVYSRQVFEKVGLFKEQYPVYADYEWNLDALLNHKVSFFYFNSIVTTFYTGGISNNAKNIENKQIEVKIVKHKYFKQAPIRAITSHLKTYQKIYNKLTNSRINRVY